MNLIIVTDMKFRLIMYWSEATTSHTWIGHIPKRVIWKRFEIFRKLCINTLRIYQSIGHWEIMKVFPSIGSVLFSFLSGKILARKGATVTKYRKK